MISTMKHHVLILILSVLAVSACTKAPSPSGTTQCAGTYSESTFGCMEDRSGVALCVSLADGGLDCAHKLVCSCPQGEACMNLDPTTGWVSTCAPKGAEGP
jgi:hypothetical protein